MIRHLEEDLGVWESVEPELTAANEMLDSRERELGIRSQESQGGTSSEVKCQDCNFTAKNATQLKGHMTGHIRNKCEQTRPI